jgi:membrane-associated phospholipid phosphatase
MRIYYILIISFLLFGKTFAQSDSIKVSDSISINSNGLPKKWFNSHYIKESIVPVSLTLGSVAIITIPGLKESLQKPLSWNWDETTKTYNYNLSLDGLPHNYLLEDDIRYAPVVAAYALSLCGLKSKHRFIDRSAILLVSYVASDFVVYRGKKLTKSLRPGRDENSKDDYSMPSQHTAMAFVAASFLDHELGYISPWISVGGYAAASWVGIARMANNSHWASDVLMGAAVGLLTTNATYWAYDGVMKLFPKHLTIAPIIDTQQTGLYVCYKF